MKHKLLTLLALAALLLSTPAFAQSNSQFRALLFTKTVGYHHESIHAGVAAIKAMGERHLFAVQWEESARVFSDEGLSRYDVIIFLNTTQDILNEEQQGAMERFIRAGKGFAGIHAAADTEYGWEWYTQLVGRMFHSHPATQTARLHVENHNFPGMEMWPATRLWTDEWYHYTEEKTKGLNYLLRVDEKSYDPKIRRNGEVTFEGMGDVHPIAWYHEFDGGRSFYTGLGHVPATFSDPVFLEHLFGGIYWAATGKGTPTSVSAKNK